jgi:hypothetical protein
MRGEMPRFVKGASTSLSDTPAVIELVHDSSDESSTDFPPVAVLGKFVIALTSIVGATNVTWYLSADADGDVPITPSHTAAITAGETAGKGGFAVLLDASSAIPDDYYVQGKVYAVVSVDTGTTATGVPWLEFWR